MKIKILLLCVLATGLAACSNSSGTQKSPGSGEIGNRIPFSGLPELKRNFKPTGLSKKLISRDGDVFAPMNFQKQTLTLNFDAADKAVSGHSIIFFVQDYSGRPYFEILPQVTSAKLNGVEVSVSRIADPDGLGNSYTALSRSLSSGSYNVLELEYDLPSSNFSFANGGVGFLTDMTDLSPANYFEVWGPANFEDDAFALTLNLEVENTDVAHNLFTNGRTTQLNARQWTIDFPSHFTTSSFYVHLTHRDFITKRFAIATQGRSIPITVYGADGALVEQAASALPGLFNELETDYGQYPHDGFVAYMQNSGGGMEYVGATITSLSALDHELFHSWFARGVMPAEGRSGWIDEAFASWRDNGYFKAETLLQREPTKLAAFSPFRKSTPSNCYRDGRRLIAELDVFLAEFGGMKPLIKEFQARYRYRVVTTEEFITFLGAKTERDVLPFFERYVYGVANSGPNLEKITSDFGLPENGIWDDKISNHPARLTQDVVRTLR